MNAIVSKTSCPSIMPTEAINRVFAQAKCILVVSHIDPDGDAIGTQLAFGEYLKRQGKNVLMTRDSEIPDKYLFLSGVQEIVEARTLSAECKIDAALVLE